MELVGVALAVTVAIAALAGYLIRRYRLAGAGVAHKTPRNVAVIEYGGKTYAISFPEQRRRGSRFDAKGPHEDLIFITDPIETD